ncbi:MAG: restriction endonuclease subunit S [Candidatus Hodarchaeales archaeon]
MSDWEFITIEELINSGFCKIRNTKREPLSKMQRASMKEGELYPYYGAARAIDEINDYRFSGFHLLVAEDGTVTSNGSSPMLQLVDGKFWVSNHAHVLQANSKLETLLLYYMLRKVDINPYITGAVQPKLSKKNLLSITLYFPKDKSISRSITTILGSLDDKINLLHRQNETLEALAQTLFRQWFVEEAEATWEEKELSFFGQIICGKTPSKKKPEYFDGDIPFIKIPDMHGNVFVFNTGDTLSEAGKNSQINKTLPAKSICVSCIATVGLVSMNIVESQTNQQINSIIPKKPEYRYFLFLHMRRSTDLLTAMASGGTATLNLNTGNFSKIIVNFPRESLLLDFHNLIEPVFNKIFHNQSQIQTLEKLRDTLLPKLMSGNIRVI